MGHRLNPAFIFLQSRVEKDMQSNFCMRMGSTCFTFLYRVTQNSFSPKKKGGVFSFWAPAATLIWQNPCHAPGSCTTRCVFTP